MGDHRLTRITTRTGDAGETGLADGSRLPKPAARITALGEVDELNACIGLLAVLPALPDHLGARLRDIQQRLFDVGGELSLPGKEILARDAIAALDADIAAWNAQLPPLTEFVLPGSDEANARAHLARAVCRRAERSLWQLHADDARVQPLAAWLNRLSDWLFVLARMLARETGAGESTWQRGTVKNFV
jgi:cob(I)alamin adenosyltransferase